jgi:hypothetical protein
MLWRPLWREDGSVIYCILASGPSPNLEGQVSVFISTGNRVAQLYTRALGSLFVASYDSQGYGGGILTRLHTGLTSAELSWVEFILRPTVSRPRLGIGLPFGTHDQVLSFPISIVHITLGRTKWKTVPHPIVTLLPGTHLSRCVATIASTSPSPRLPMRYSQNALQYVWFWGIIAVTSKYMIVWDATPYGVVDVSWSVTRM